MFDPSWNSAMNTIGEEQVRQAVAKMPLGERLLRAYRQNDDVLFDAVLQEVEKLSALAAERERAKQERDLLTDVLECSPNQTMNFLTAMVSAKMGSIKLLESELTAERERAKVLEEELARLKKEFEWSGDMTKTCGEISCDECTNRFMATKARAESAEDQLQSLGELVETYRTGIEPLHKKFHDFQNSPYRGEWRQAAMTFGDLKKILEGLPPSSEYPKLSDLSRIPATKQP